MILTYPEAQVLERHFVCSDCWERLTLHPAEGQQMRDVHCDTPQCDCNGFISLQWVESEEREQENRKRNLLIDLAGKLEWIPEKNHRQSIKSLLEDLGF